MPICNFSQHFPPGKLKNKIIYNIYYKETTKFIELAKCSFPKTTLLIIFSPFMALPLPFPLTLNRFTHSFKRDLDNLEMDNIFILLFFITKIERIPVYLKIVIGSTFEKLKSNTSVYDATFF